MFPTPLQTLAEVYLYTRWLFWRKCIRNYCTVSYFLQAKGFREYFESATCIKRGDFIDEELRTDAVQAAQFRISYDPFFSVNGKEKRCRSRVLAIWHLCSPF